MSDTTAPTIRHRRQDRVVWPDPSPLADWWERVMYTENADTPTIHQLAS